MKLRHESTDSGRSTSTHHVIHSRVLAVIYQSEGVCPLHRRIKLSSAYRQWSLQFLQSSWEFAATCVKLLLGFFSERMTIQVQPRPSFLYQTNVFQHIKCVCVCMGIASKPHIRIDARTTT